MINLYPEHNTVAISKSTERDNNIDNISHVMNILNDGEYNTVLVSCDGFYLPNSNGKDIARIITDRCFNAGLIVNVCVSNLATGETIYDVDTW
jgi:elongation factor P hydroxylase